MFWEILWYWIHFCGWIGSTLLWTTFFYAQEGIIGHFADFNYFLVAYLHLCGFTLQFSPQKLQSMYMYFWLTPKHEPLADNLETPQTPLNDGFVVIAGLPQALNLLVPNYTPVWREALWDWCVLPKNTTQCPRPGLEPELLKLVASACTNLEATTQQPVVGYIT